MSFSQDWQEQSWGGRTLEIVSGKSQVYFGCSLGEGVYRGGEENIQIVENLEAGFSVGMGNQEIFENRCVTDENRVSR